MHDAVVMSEKEIKKTDFVPTGCIEMNARPIPRAWISPLTFSLNDEMCQRIGSGSANIIVGFQIKAAVKKRIGIAALPCSPQNEVDEGIDP